MVPSWLRRCAGHRDCCRHGEEREGGAARRLAEFLAGVRRTKIKDRRYKAGWTRLSMGGRKRRVAALVVGTRTRMGTRGGGRAWAWRATVTAGDRMTARRMPTPSHFGKGGSLLPPPPIIGDPWMAMTRTVGIRSGRVIRVITRLE